MPKASKARKKTTKIGTVQQRPSQSAVGAAQSSTQASVVPQATVSPAARSRLASRGVAGPQSLVFPAMVALGCWGMAFTLAYFYSDPNRFLFAGMAALMGVFWTYSLYMRYMRLRKIRETK
jgi:hypothetical protein